MAGRPKDVSDKEILEAVKIVFGPATAGEVSDQVELNNSGANKRLKKLVNNGKLNQKKVGAKAKVYWLTDEGERYLQS